MKRKILLKVLLFLFTSTCFSQVSFRTGSTSPTLLTNGKPGDIYLNTKSGMLYKHAPNGGHPFYNGGWNLIFNLANNSWQLLGNSATNPEINFIGTVTGESLVFKINNQNAGLIERGDIGITTFGGNTFFGFHSDEAYVPIGKSLANTAIGANSLASNTNGEQNTAIGSFTLFMNNDVLNDGTKHASFNTAVGAGALYSTTVGVHNTSIGYSAMHNNNTGSSNAAFGDQALNLNTTGFWNTAFGFKSLFGNLTGSSNTAIGTYSASNTIGNNNTALGYQALQLNKTGTLNTALGYNADVTVDNLHNATCMGYNAKVSASNALVLGATGIDQVNVGIGTTSPASMLEIKGGNIYINSPTLSTLNGVILKSPNGTCWLITIDNNGDLQRKSITCP